MANNTGVNYADILRETADKYNEAQEKLNRELNIHRELEAFIRKLVKAAELGKYSVRITDLDIKFPTIYHDVIWEWCRENNISMYGGADNNGTHADYSFYWEHN